MQFKLTKYSASWCQPCKQLQKALDELQLPAGLLQHVDVDSADRLMLQNLGIRGVPLLVLTKDGTEVDRRSGYMQAENIYKWLEQHQVLAAIESYEELVDYL